MNIYYNPLDAACKSVTGGISEGKACQFTLFLLQEHVNTSCNTNSFLTRENCMQPSGRAFFRLAKDGEEAKVYPMTMTDFGWSISLKIHEIGLYFYSFEVEGVGFISCGEGERGYQSATEQAFLLTVHAKDYKTPDWFKGGVLYQIFPDRFCKDGAMSDITGRVRRADWGENPSYRPNAQGKVLNNDFFGGNFKGILSKLDYLQALGVTSIYLNPVFEAASNHRYDTSDYMKIDPYVGTDDDLKNLVFEAEKRGIRLIFDGVFNHTGDDSVYFNKYGRYPSVGAYQSKDSPYYSWYNFQEHPNRYSSWWGIDVLPDVNESSESYQNFIFGEEGVLKHWLRFGLGGYRLDVADELPDFFLKKLRKSVKDENPDAIIIGEVWEDASNKIAYSQRREYLQGYELDSVMNYPLKEAIIRYIQHGNAKDLLNTVCALVDHYPKATLDCLMNILGTHDTSRILTVLGGIYCNNKDEMALPSAYLTPENKQKAIEKLKMAAVLQFMLPGVPCIYYGDENGMEGHIDPFCRRCFDWDNLNTDLISFYKKLGEIRKQYKKIFKDAVFENIFTQNGCIVFKRTNQSGTIYVYTNNSKEKYLLNLSGEYQDLISGAKYKNALEIEKYSYGIIKKIK